MRKTDTPGLPRSRFSFPGGPGSKFIPQPWAAMLLLGGMLLLTGYAHVAGSLQFRHLLGVSFTSRSSNSSSTNSSITSSSMPVGAGQAAPHGESWQAGADLEKMQRMQQGVDFASNMHQMASSSSNNNDVLRLLGLNSTEDALQREPLVHGHVQKAGTTDPRSWLDTFSDDRLDSFMSWRLNRTRAGGPVAPAAGASQLTCPAADHPPLPFPGCHVFVNHQ